MTEPERSLTRTIAAFATRLRLSEIPPSVQAKAKLHILDSIGCGIAGAASDLARRIFAFLQIEHRHGPCPVLGSTLWLGPAGAAMANSAAINALDFDDGFEIAGKGMGHPGATIVAAAVSAAAVADVTGGEFLSAVVAAYEINNRHIRAMQPTGERFRKVYGVCQHQSLAAALAYGKLLGLNEHALENAVGLAATLANVPSLRKYNWERRPLISLKDFTAPATEAGVRAVQLHACGLVGSKDVLEGDQGFWRMLGSDQFDASSLLSELGCEWTLPHNSFKSYPVCRWMHSALEAVAAVMAENEISGEQIEAVTVHTSSAMARDFMQCAPGTMVDAQFSLPYALAALALGIRPGGEWFEQQTLTRSDLRMLQRRVVAVVDPEIDALMSGPLRRPSARADVRAGGRNFTSRLFEYPSGSAESPISEAAVHAKFVSNVAPVFGKQRAAQLLARFNALEVETHMQPLLKLCRAA